MKLTHLLVGAAVAVIAATAQAATTNIDFTALASGTTVTNQYAGVIFSLAGGLAAGDPQIAYYGAGLSNSPTAGFYPTADSLIATFSSAASAVSFTFNNEGYNGFNNYQVYSPTHTLVDSGALSANPSFTYVLADGKIGSIVWSNGEGTSRSWTQALSTLSYTTGAVPEPATWALMLGGFGMIGATMRRRATVGISLT